ncbi:MAG: Mrp/NBP35 family ATP-binding protein [Oscillospiraceae bacterium]|nr:Mrp/NBP35 family ATP-binding protein [Oscillospiraceae bacterium]
MDECTHDCGSCSSCGDGGCGEQGHEHRPEDFLAEQNEMSNIRHVIGVMSGKGGVGKSLITASLAVELKRQGYRVGVLDADVTGPSIPRAFGVTGRAQSTETFILPRETKTGIQLMSLNLLVDHETDPVVWRGPMVGDLVKQFWTHVAWGEIDYLLVDLPPGTGDVPLTIFQSLPVNGVIVVTSPQELVSMIVTKAVKMAKMMNIPVLGLVENYGYFKCPDCGSEHSLFGASHLDEVARQLEVPALDRLPIDPEMGAKCDAGAVEDFKGGYLNASVEAIKKLK